MSERKESVSLALRPALVKKIDTLARQVGLSRSECVSRIVGRVIDQLSQPDTDWINLKRSYLLDILQA